MSAELLSMANSSQEEFDSLIDEISSEIDSEYDECYDDETEAYPQEPQPAQHHIHSFLDYVKSIPSIHQLFSYQKELGRGISGGVFLARCRQTDKVCALKQMLRSAHIKLNAFAFMNELKILKALDHPNIVRLYGAYISNQHYCLTTEYCSGGTLLDKIFVMKRFSEINAAVIMKNILNAVQYIHNKNIAHRDIKLDNILFDRNSNLKLIDFGQSECIADGSKTDRCIFGTVPYLPPETMRPRRKYELFAGDMWAVGVIAYILVQGNYPFAGKSIKSVIKSIHNNPLKWDRNISVSDECKDFIESLLNKDASMRLTAKHALQHPWIVNRTYDNVSKNAIANEYLQRLMAWKNIIVHEIDDSQINFDDIDIDKILAEIDTDNKEPTKYKTNSLVKIFSGLCLDFH